MAFILHLIYAVLDLNFEHTEHAVVFGQIQRIMYVRIDIIILSDLDAYICLIVFWSI